MSHPHKQDKKATSYVKSLGENIEQLGWIKTFQLGSFLEGFQDSPGVLSVSYLSVSCLFLVQVKYVLFAVTPIFGLCIVTQL